MTRLSTYDLNTFNRATVGFNRMLQEVERSFHNSANNAYPPYNVVQLSDTEWDITIAVAGFTMDDLDITLDNDTLTISGTSPKLEDVNYLHKGIGGRNFRKQFTLADHVEVVDAKLSLGLLNIRLKRHVPEELLPKKIEIKYISES